MWIGFNLINLLNFLGESLMISNTPTVGRLRIHPGEMASRSKSSSPTQP